MVSLSSRPLTVEWAERITNVVNVPQPPSKDEKLMKLPHEINDQGFCIHCHGGPLGLWGAYCYAREDESHE